MSKKIKMDDIMRALEKVRGAPVLTSNQCADLAEALNAATPACRQRLAAEGKPYPRSSCAICGAFSPKWRECDALIEAGGEEGKNDQA